MTPGSFDIDTCKEVVGDARMRIIESKARADADAGVKASPPEESNHYWDRVRTQMEWVVYTTTHQKRLERIQRIKEKK